MKYAATRICKADSRILGSRSRVVAAAATSIFERRLGEYNPDICIDRTRPRTSKRTAAGIEIMREAAACAVFAITL